MRISGNCCSVCVTAWDTTHQAEMALDWRMILAGMGPGQTGSGRDPGRGSECPVLVRETGDSVTDWAKPGHVT